MVQETRVEEARWGTLALNKTFLSRLETEGACLSTPQHSPST